MDIQSQSNLHFGWFSATHENFTSNAINKISTSSIPALKNFSAMLENVSQKPSNDMDIQIQRKFKFGGADIFKFFYNIYKKVKGDTVNLANPSSTPSKTFFELLKESTQKPDFDERGLFGNWHFFSPTINKSYLDFNGKNNALYHYKMHVSNMLSAISEKNIEQVMEHAGRALHFLQDGTQPMHSKGCTFFNTFTCFKTHRSFEKFLEKCQDKFFKSNKYKPSHFDTFEDLYMNNVALSQKSELPTSKNKYDWESIGETGVRQAMDSTRDFLEKLAMMLDDSQISTSFVN